MNPNEIKNFHLIAVCGTGMASLAGLLKQAGHKVVGSDANIYPPMSTLLQDLNIPVKPGYKAENITPDIDIAVIGNAVSKDNDEVQAVQQQNIRYLSFPETLSQFFLEGKKSLVVTGTHGKTTTTSLLAWTLYHAGRDPGFMVGGWLKNFDSNHRFGAGEHFAVEGDEYDTAFFDKGPKFLHYQPHAAILTGIEFDHADIFTNLDQIKDAFLEFVDIIDPDGFLLVAHGDPNIKDVTGNAPCEIESYGFSSEADWAITDYQWNSGAGRFRLVYRGNRVGDFSLPMTGRQNALNSAAVAALCLRLGLKAEEIAAAYTEFAGIKRRQEVVGVENGVTVIDDFAHHPTAIDLTLAGIKEAWKDSRLWAVFEPRSATSRRNVFQEALPKSFGPADRVVIAAPFAPEKVPEEERLDPDALINSIKASGKEAWYIPEVEDIVDHLSQECQPGDVVMVMSSGGFDGIHQRLLERLKKVNGS